MIFLKEKYLRISALFNIIQYFPIGLRKVIQIIHLICKAPSSQRPPVIVRLGYGVLQ